MRKAEENFKVQLASCWGPIKLWKLSLGTLKGRDLLGSKQLRRNILQRKASYWSGADQAKKETPKKAIFVKETGVLGVLDNTLHGQISNKRKRGK